MNSEVELQAFRENVILAVRGTVVQIEGGVIGDHIGGPITDDGVAAILDRLTARGFKVVRVG